MRNGAATVIHFLYRISTIIRAFLPQDFDCSQLRVSSRLTSALLSFSKKSRCICLKRSVNHLIVTGSTLKSRMCWSTGRLQIPVWFLPGRLRLDLATIKKARTVSRQFTTNQDGLFCHRLLCGGFKITGIEVGKSVWFKVFTYRRVDVVKLEGSNLGIEFC